MLSWLRKLIKPSWRRPYHLALAALAAWRYGFPSRRLAVIGITGTDGKTTTATLTAAALRSQGAKVGLSSTVWVDTGRDQRLNESHMTMPGRFALQRMLSEMVQADCTYAVLEVSSEGIAQWRLAGIEVDVAVLTNISPEHVESHGSFEKYRAAKLKLFEHLGSSRKKVVEGRTIPKVAVVNMDTGNSAMFLSSAADRKIGTTLQSQNTIADDADTFRASDLQADKTGTSFSVNGARCRVNLPGKYNVSNALQAIAVANALGIPIVDAARAVESIREIPGRFETMDAGQGRQVVIDYALTPAALREFYGALKAQGAKGIIAVFGAAGGGRDTWKRPELGKVASEFAKYIILTIDDPHDEDPARIAEEIKRGISANVQSEIILDRRAAIQRALEVAQAGEVIALTGMGSETSMNVAGGRKVEWNDRKVVEKLIVGL